MNEGCSVNSERLWERLSALGRIGRTADGGITRLSFTKEERQAKDLVASYMEEAGLSVREDAAGNLIGRRDGLRKDAPVVMTGSHLDTVPGGGAFDGALGVLGAVEALKSMRERSAKTLHPIEIVCFTDEEGARFGAGMLGSRAMAGILDAAHLRHTDQHGVTVMQAMAEAGLPAERLHEAARAPSDVKAYVELHIEQGKVLERKDVPVGVVSGIAGPLWMKFKVSGEAGHAGA
ncbi:MAG: Zn-dependent hydrolase, partial [Christensenellales bacterium]